MGGSENGWRVGNRLRTKFSETIPQTTLQNWAYEETAVTVSKSYSPLYPVIKSHCPCHHPFKKMESFAQKLSACYTHFRSELFHRVHLVGRAQVICLHPSCKGGWKFEFWLQCWGGGGHNVRMFPKQKICS